MGVNSMMMVVLLLGGGNSGDFLDFIPTDAYWQMRDQRIVDAETMSAVLADGEASVTDTLMAIRALGEVTQADNVKPNIKAEAIELLTPLTASKEPFVGQYAKRSIAWIRGEEPEAYAALPAEVYDLDLALLPAESNFVGQLKMHNGVNPIDFAGLFPDIEVDGKSMREMMMQQLMPGMLQGAAMIGNARADLVTAGMILDRSADTGQEKMLMVVVARGQYDRVGVQLALEEELGEQEDWSFYSVGDVEVVANPGSHDPIAMLMPSDELFVFMFSEQRDTKLPIDDIANKLAQADRKPAFNDLLAKQVDAVDREQADIWAAVRVSQMMKDERGMRDVFGAFDAGRAFATRDDEGAMEIRWAGEGSDAGQVGVATTFFTESIKEGIAQIHAEKLQMPAAVQPMMDPVIAMLESMAFEHDGKTMTGGMKVQSDIGTMLPMMMGVQKRPRAAARMRAEEAVEAAP